MNRLLIGAAGLVLAGSVTAPGCLSQASAAPNCGGNSTSHLAPIDCTNTLTVQGVTGGAHLTVTTSGAIHVDAQVNNKQVALYLQVKANDASNNGQFNGATAVFANGLASVNLTMFGCLSQIDIKIAPGTPTLDHISDIYRVAGPLVELPNCVASTSVPQSSTTVTPPSSTVPPPVSVTTPGAPSAPATSTAGGGTHSQRLPATGSNGAAVGIGLGLLVGGLLLLTAAVRRRPS